MDAVSFSELAHFTPRQLEATQVADTHRYTLFGGSRGPGKSYWLRWYCLRFLLRKAAEGFRGLRVMLACEDYPALRDRHVDRIIMEYPPYLGYWSPSRFEFRLHDAYGGGIIALRNLDDPSKYQSAEFALIAVDELTKNPRRTFDVLRASLRWPGLDRTQFIAATNPTGPGAAWVRELWIERRFPPEFEDMADEFAFVRALPGDNPYLPDSYLDELRALPEPLRRAWLEGDWYAGVEGLVYGDFSDANITDEDPVVGVPVELAVDDGYIDPRAILLIQRLPDRILVIDELYHTRHLAEECVREALEKCAEYGLGRPELAIGSPEAKELQEQFRRHGVPFRYRPHKVVDGINIVRRLIRDSNGYRTLYVHKRCRNLIWELTEGYQYQEGRQSLLDRPADGNDHACDALRYWAYVRASRMGTEVGADERVAEAHIATSGR